jgi:hypothetical protein
MRSYIDLDDSFRRQFGRKRFLPLLLWSALMLSPLLSIGSWEIGVESLLFSTRISTAEIFFAFLDIHRFVISLISITSLPGYYLMFSLRFVFIRDLFRFNEGNVSQSRLISLGILSEMAPAAMLTMFQFSYIMVLDVPIWYYVWIMPTPVFPLLGYVFARMSRHTLTSDTLWEDEENVMWFESDQEPMETRIKVPISYLIRSHLRKLRR